MIAQPQTKKISLKDNSKPSNSEVISALNEIPSDWDQLDINIHDPLINFLKNSRLPEVTQSLLTDGYAILPSILSKSEYESALNLMWEFVEDVSSGNVHRTDPTTWYPNKNNENDNNDDPWPHTGYSSFPDMFQSHGAGFLLGHIREMLAERVFEPLYNTKKLHCSKEGFTFHRPSIVEVLNDQWKVMKHENKEIKVCGRIQSQSRGEHYDQSHEKYGLHTIQSSVAFLDQVEGKDGCFLCYPKSHSKIHHLITENKYRGKFDWIPLTDAEIQILQDEYGLQPKLIYVKAGDVIVWRSDLVHAAVAPTPKAVNFRAVSYTSMLPSIFTKSDQMEKKFLAYKLCQTGDHRAHVEDHWHVHKRKASSNLRPYFRFGPPKVSWRMAELYGLVPYDITDKEEENAVRKRVVRRGVRFVEADTSKQIELLPKRGVPCSAKLEILQPSTGPILGQDKYLGGVASPCGEFIYGVCGHAKRTLRVRCDNGKVDFIGPEFEGKFKWLRGVDIPTDVMRMGIDNTHSSYMSYSKGICLALPCNADSILKINPYTNEVTTFGGPFKGGWKWHGGNLASNGMIYAIPADTNRVLKIDPRTEETFFIGPDFGYRKQKWFGGVFAKRNGCIYGIPHNANGVLKINPFTEECTILGEGQLPDGEWKWHGGLANLDGSKIYGFPNNAKDVLVVDTIKDIVYTVCSPDFDLKAGRHRKDDKYKYLGGALSLDGKFVYLFPCDAERVLRIETESDTLKLIGPELLEGENKYQNGFAGKDGCIYAIPQRASSVLRIVPPSMDKDKEGNVEFGDEMVEMVYCGDSMVAIKDKFEGGVMGVKDGAIYCIPLRAKAVARVVLKDPKRTTPT